MDSILLAFPPDGDVTNQDYDKAAKSHITKIKNLFKDQTPAIVTSSEQLLELLNPAVNSISYLAILNTIKRLDGSNAPLSHSDLLRHILRFLLLFDARQIRYVGEVFLDLVKDVAGGSLFSPHQAVEILATVILRLDPRGQLLTSTHHALVKLAYDTNQVDAALNVIDKTYSFVPGMVGQNDAIYLSDLTASPPTYITQATGLTLPMPRELIIEYDLYCGLIYCSKHMWEKAHQAFQRIVAFPARDGGVSKYMTESYKKWILTGLLALGQMPTLPTYTASSASKVYSTMGKAYTEIATLFSTTNAAQLKAETEKFAKVWEDDHNVGIIKEVIAGYQKWQIIGLSDVYCKLSIPEVREQTQSADTGKQLETDAEVETLIKGMIESKMLRGALEPHPDGSGTICLSFLPPGEEISEEEFAQEVAAVAQRLKSLGQVVQTTNERLSTSKDYVRSVAREQKRQEKEGENRDPGYGFDNSVEDEDLMTGIVQGA